MVQMSLTLTLIPVSHRVLAAGGAASRVQGLGDRGRAHQVPHAVHHPTPGIMASGAHALHHPTAAATAAPNPALILEGTANAPNPDPTEPLTPKGYSNPHPV